MWGVVVLSSVAELALAVVDAAAIEGGTIVGLAAWLLAISWIGTAAFLVWNWWFFRWRIALAPLSALAALLLLGGRPG